MHRVMVSKGGAMVHRLAIAFAPAASAAFASIVERMARSFRLNPAR